MLKARARGRAGFPMWLVIALSILLLAAGIAEEIRLRRLSDRVPLRILVNGTRGKSSVTRMLVAALNGCGIRTSGKTTGSAARFIFPDLSEEPVPRRRGIMMVAEHTLLFKKAVEHGSQAIVCECMAIREENQQVVGSRLVRPSITIITNARPDHIDLMGKTSEETARVLCRCIGPSEDVFTSDHTVEAELAAAAEDGGVRVHFAATVEESGKDVLNKCSFRVHEENLALVLAVCRHLGLDDGKVLESVTRAVPDPGMTDILEVDGHTVVNGFAANDPESAKRLFEGRDIRDVTVVYNNRADREFRLPMFRDLLAEMEVDDIVVTGDNTGKCRRMFEKAIPGCNVRMVGKDGIGMAVLDSCRHDVVCMGNIKGAGERMLEVFGNAV